MGKSTWRLIARKKGRYTCAAKADNSWTTETECESGMRLEDLLTKIKNAEGKCAGGKGHWIFRETFLSDSGVGLAQVITSDDGFEQHFYIKIIPGGSGYKIKVDSVGHPYRTPAMRAALRCALDAARDKF